jgi:putative peptidoglycan lipid II flippase
MYLPIGLFGVSIGTAVLPAVSRHAAVGDTAGIRDTVSRGLGMMLMMNVPATFGLFVLATPIVRLLFERGQFLPGDTAATAAAVRFYAVGLAGYSAARIASPTFYAIGESRVPAMVSGGVILVNAVASILLVRAIGFEGLALGTSVAAVANAAVLVWLLRRRLGGLNGRRLCITFVKVTAAALVMALTAVAIQRTTEHAFSGRQAGWQAVRLAASIGGALMALAGASKFLRVDEFDRAVGMIQGRVRKLLEK